jgi:hypothetical protein
VTVAPLGDDCMAGMTRGCDVISSPVRTTSRPPSLWREIAVILGFKLMALIALYYLFFDERPHITPDSVEQRVLDGPVPTEGSHD